MSFGAFLSGRIQRLKRRRSFYLNSIMEFSLFDADGMMGISILFQFSIILKKNICHDFNFMKSCSN